MSAHILIVDDSRTVRQLVRGALEQAGFQVTEAVDGRNALDLVGGVNPDLIITDVNMPEMDGISLVRELRARVGFPNIPILILTTLGDPESKEKGRQAGATGWMSKPFEPAKLLGAVAKVLKT
jgi:two-component system, chemotaxis family, chemotaxis protein CheY